MTTRDGTRRSRVRLHLEEDGDRLTLAGVSRASPPARRSRTPPTTLTAFVLDDRGRQASSAPVLPGQCCVAGAKGLHQPRRPHVVDVMARLDEKVVVEDQGRSHSFALNAEVFAAATAPRQRPSVPAAQIQAIQRADTSKTWVVIALANGFDAAGMGAFRDYVRTLEQRLRETPPFDRFASRIKVFGLETRSPVNRPGPDSAFGHEMQSLDPAREWFLITVDQDAVARFLRFHRLTKQNFQPLVVTNTDLYGGSGGPAAVVSLDENALGIGIHEIGHSEFGLSDEYASHVPNPDRFTEGPNVSKGFSPLKWQSQLTVGPPFPTVANPTGAEVPPMDRADLAGFVGVFEGAFYRPKGFYRPQMHCKMRSMDEPFCVVCQDVIGKRLSGFTGLRWP